MTSSTRPTISATTGHHLGDPAMPRPLLTTAQPVRLPATPATVFGSGRHRRQPDPVVHVRTSPATAPANEATPAPVAGQDAPATRSDVDRLETMVAELLAREERQTAALLRVEDGLLSLLLDVENVRVRLDEIAGPYEAPPAD